MSIGRLFSFWKYYRSDEQVTRRRLSSTYKTTCFCFILLHILHLTLSMTQTQVTFPVGLFIFEVLNSTILIYLVKISHQFYKNYELDMARAQAYDCGQIEKAMREGLVDTMPVENVEVVCSQTEKRRDSSLVSTLSERTDSVKSQ